MMVVRDIIRECASREDFLVGRLDSFRVAPRNLADERVNDLDVFHNPARKGETDL